MIRSPAAAKRTAAPTTPALGVLHVLGCAGDGRQQYGITGVERVVESLLEGLGRGFEQSVVYPAAGVMSERYRELAVALVPAQPQRHFDRAFLRTMIHVIRDRRIDVVVSHGSRYDFHAALAARRTGVAHVVRRPVALADEVFSRLRRPIYRRVDAWTLAHARGIVAVSAASKQRMLETQGLTSDRIEIVPNGVAVPNVSTSERDAARTTLGVDGDAFVIGGVGQLIERKAFHLLIDAAAQLRTIPARPIIVALVGDGPQRQQLSARAGARGVPLALVGYKERPQASIAAFDVAVLPSRAEGMPLALLEAMALGRACIVTPAAGSVEVVEEGVSGFFVPFDDVAALATALQRLYDDPGERQRIGAAARERIGAHFSLDAMRQRYRALLRRAAGRDARTGRDA